MSEPDFGGLIDALAHDPLFKAVTVMQNTLAPVLNEAKEPEHAEEVSQSMHTMIQLLANALHTAGCLAPDVSQVTTPEKDSTSHTAFCQAEGISVMGPLTKYAPQGIAIIGDPAMTHEYSMASGQTGLTMILPEHLPNAIAALTKLRDLIADAAPQD